MTRARSLALQMIRERRAFPIGSYDYEYRTRAARTYVRMALKVPAMKWKPL